MNTFWKIVFWSFTIGVGFVNPLICFGLIVLYYLPGIFHAASQTEAEHAEPKMNSFSEDVLEDMK